jgi:hypothetical protein
MNVMEKHLSIKADVQQPALPWSFTYVIDGLFLKE